MAIQHGNHRNWRGLCGLNALPSMHCALPLPIDPVRTDTVDTAGVDTVVEQRLRSFRGFGDHHSARPNVDTVMTRPISGFTSAINQPVSAGQNLTAKSLAVGQREERLIDRRRAES